MNFLEYGEDIHFFDIETNGFYRETDRIHCLSMKRGSQPVVLYVGPIQVGIAINMLDKADRVCAHNGLGFDCPVIMKLYKVNLAPKCIDTLVLSCLSNPERFGGHSLDNLAKQFGSWKGEYTGGWEEYNEAMGEYCIQDSAALYQIYHGLLKEMEGHDWKAAVALEHKVATVVAWQERCGWHFNTQGAKNFITDITQAIQQADDELASLLTPKIVKKGERKLPISPFTGAGKPSAVAEKWCTENGLPFDVIGGPFFPVEVVWPDLNSRQQMIELLQSFGWKPTEWTEKGNPRLTEDSVVDTMGPTGQLLFDRFVMVTRRGQVGGWIGKVRDDGRIEAGAFPNATPTARMRHRTVVNVPRVTSKYGTELRSLFCVPDGSVQVGADAAGLELRLLAHYMGDAAYTDAVVNGKSSDESDVHSVNCKLLGLEPKKQYVFNKKETSGRDIAKTFIYAFLYGAGDEKLGSIIDGDAAAGARLRKKFLTGLPKLAKLIERVKKAAAKGWLLGIDGRKIYVRHEHAALNSLLQSAGSIAVKVAMVKWAHELQKNKVPFKLLGTFHDEVQAETLPEWGETVGLAFVMACAWAGRHLKLRCPLSGEYMIGKNWAQCH